MKYFIALLGLLGGISCQMQETGKTSALPAATYQNPLMQGHLLMGDPFVLRHDSTYYLYGTNAPGRGFITWTSRDLVHWDSLGFAYERTDSSYGQSNFWAPEVFYYPPHERFYLVYTTKHDKESPLNICLAQSERPEGPFKDLYTPWIDIEGWGRIDGHVFVDEDGTPFLYFDKVGVVGKPWEKPSTGYLYGLLYAVQLHPDLSSAVGEPVLCVQADQDWENPQSMHSRCNEGAYVLKHQGQYYLTYSANHYADPAYGIGYATASHPLGPWTKNPDNPLMATDSLRQFSGPGHNSFTTSPNGGELFMVYHAHADWQHPSGKRTVNIDRVHFDAAGRLVLEGPSRSAQGLPE